MKRALISAGFAASLFFIAATAFAQAPRDAALEARLKTLSEELRCLVCQNQTLADSTAPLAEDLRREVRELAQQGKTDAEIKEYLTARYGDFVLYKPPVKPTTWILWFGPFAFLLGGGLLWFVVLRRRRRGGSDDNEPPVAGQQIGGEQAERARRLLGDEPDK
jgi:cytochrome c-type biogenesis protein CcmH